MSLTRRDIADDFDAVDEKIAELNAHKSAVLSDYRAQLADEGIPKAQIKLEIDATKAAIKRLRAVAKDRAAVEEKDDLVDEIADEIARSRARRTTRVENIEEFPVEHDEDGVFPDDEPQSAPQAAQMRAADGVGLSADQSLFTSPAGAEGIVNRQPIYPETANTVPSIEGVNAPMMVAADANAGGENVADHHSVDTVEKTDFVDNLPRAGALASSSDVETVAPSNITTIRPAKTMRPHCLKPEACGGQGRSHCWSCTKAMTQSGDDE